MPQQEPGRGGPLGPLDWFKILPHEPAASSDRLGWAGLEAARNRAVPASELHAPAITHHRLILFSRPPEELDLLYEGVKRHVPPPAGAILVVPAGSPTLWRWSGSFDSLHVFLEPGLFARVGAEAFGLDGARVTLPPLDGLDLPHLRTAMLAVDAELTAGGAGGSLAAESMANILAVHLIRHVSAPRQPTHRRAGTLPRAKLRAVVEYIEEHRDSGPTLEQMAAIAGLSPNYFAWQFKRATGLPPHQYVLDRRVERAKQFLQTGSDISLAEVAAEAGFSDQSQFSHHFKRLELRSVGASRDVILCAGAIHTPRLLLLSGIGPPADLARLGIPTVVDLPGVGRNLQDHVLIRGLCFEAGRPLPAPNNNLGGSACFWKSRPALGRPDLMVLPLQVPLISDEIAARYPIPPSNVFVILPALMRPQSRGALRLRTAEASGPLEIQPNFQAEQADVDALVAGVELGLEIASQPAYRDVIRNWIAPPRRMSREQPVAFIRRACSTYNHPVGTCAMGSGREAVVDAELRVRGALGLRIADASVMPTIPSANTNAPSIMIGEFASRLLVGD